jgi:uncharacterized SAM-binding protein YcdF (DUF218 family)
VLRSIMSLRHASTWKSLLWRLVAIVAILMVGYVAVTFGQVLWASQRDGASEADAVVVLGAAQYDGRPSPVLESRLEHAYDLYARGMAGTIVVTGGKQEGDAFTEAHAGYTYMRQRGVPESDLLREEQGTNTWESLAAAARILRDRGLTRAILVTDGYHSLRVRAIADELGLDASVSPSRRGGTLRELVQETGAVAVGRIVGFRRLVNIDGRINGSTPGPVTDGVAVIEVIL